MVANKGDGRGGEGFQVQRPKVREPSLWGAGTEFRWVGVEEVNGIGKGDEAPTLFRLILRQ